MRQLLLKANAARRFWNVTRSVLEINSYERVSRFLAERFRRGEPLALPRAIVMRTTERCFLKCKMCGQNGEAGRLTDVAMRERERIADDVYQSMTEEIRQWHNKPLVKFTGGEPLLEWKVLRPTIQQLASMGCCIKLNSNGVLLKRETLAEEVVRAGVHYLSVSIDGSRGTHAFIRGVPSAFEDSLRGVRNIQEARRRLNTPYPLVLISCVISAWNEEKVRDIVEVAREFQADWLNLQFLNFLTPQRSKAAHEFAKEKLGTDDRPWEGFELPQLARIDPVRLAESIKWIKRHAPCPVSTMKIGGLDADNLHRFHYTDQVIKTHICHMPWVTSFVVPPGRLAFCIDYPYYFYGDLREEGLAAAWYGDKAATFRRAYVDHYHESGATPPMCRRCNWPYNT